MNYTFISGLRDNAFSPITQTLTDDFLQWADEALSSPWRLNNDGYVSQLEFSSQSDQVAYNLRWPDTRTQYDPMVLLVIKSFISASGSASLSDEQQRNIADSIQDMFTTLAATK